MMIFDRVVQMMKPRTVTGSARYYALVAIVASFVIFFGFWSFGSGVEVLVIPVLPMLAIAYRSILLGLINLGWILFLSYFYDFGWAHHLSDGTVFVGAWIALPVIVYVIALFRCDSLRTTEELQATAKTNTIACRLDNSVEKSELPQLFFLGFFVFVVAGLLLGSLEFTAEKSLSVFHLKPYGLRLTQLVGTLFVAFVIVEIVLRSTSLRRLKRFDARLHLQQEMWSVFGREQELFGIQRQRHRKRELAKNAKNKSPEAHADS